MLKITSLEDLKKWNTTPTEEKPCVLEWFMDWFFIDCLMKRGKNKLALDAYITMVKFTMICENMNRYESLRRVNGNLDYYSGYSSKWRLKWLEFQIKNKLEW